MAAIMRFFAVSLALGVLSLAFASPLAADEENHLVERQSSFFPVTGAQGGVSPRLEINDLANNADQWNLFLVAMARFQSQAQGNKLSYFQISGIHGRPYIDWDGVRGYSANPWWPGYCPHSSNLFGTWHRPFISLYEQLMLGHATDIANEIRNSNARARFQTAARTLRYPYWDWAKRTSGGTILPPSVTRPTIRVTFPQNGTTGTIANPLYSYRFQGLPTRGFDPPYANQPQTTRGASAESRLSGSLTTRRNSLMTLFGRNQPFNNFTTDANQNTSPNLEVIHNAIHSQVDGWMNPIAYSAFDPIFALHHCNVDRIIALWQSLYPSSWVRPAPQAGGTRTMAPLSVQGGDSPLTPFHRDTRGTFWTSNSVRNTQVLGYTYDDIQDNPSNAVLTQRITSLYGNSAPGRTLTAASAGTAHSPLTAAATTYDYLAQIILDKSALGGQPYSVDFYLEHGYIGSYAALATPAGPNAERTGPAVTSSGTMMFTDVLIEKGIDTSDLDDSINYLAKNLAWKVVQNGKTVKSVPSLNVTICSTEVKPAKSENQFDTWLESPEPIISNSTSRQNAAL